VGTPSGLLRALLDAIHGQDEKIGGRRVTNLTMSLFKDDTEAHVISTVGFGEFTDGASDAQFVVGGEVIRASGRTDTKFTGLTRGVGNTKIPDAHRGGLEVLDWARNSSAIDLVWRGFLSRFAVGWDLDIIGRNLGLQKCTGWSDAIWRQIIQEVAYAGKQPIPLFHDVMEILVGSGNFEIHERLVSNPWTIFIYVSTALSTSLRGQFFLNSAEPQLTTGALSVDTDYTIIDSPLDPGPGTVGVYGVFDDTPITRRGIREGFTNYYTGGSHGGTSITLGSSPGGAGTPVLIDYNAFEAHYLPTDETIIDDADYFPYLSDNLAGIRCLLDQIRAAGIKLEIRNKI
jgi:hypothetical protein